MTITSYRAVYILIFAVLYLVSGCTPLRAPETPYTIWTPTAPAQPETEEISALFAEEEEITGPLTLAQCVDIALLNNPSTQGAWMNARKAEAEMRQTQAAWYPRAQFYVDGRVEKQELKYTTVKTIDEHSYYGPALSLTYLLFDFGGRNSAVTRAVETLRQVNFIYNQTIQDLTLEVEIAYYSLSTAWETIGIQDANVTDAKSIRSIIERKHEGGLVPELDVHKARARYEDELYARAEAGSLYETARSNLAKSLGRPTAAELRITGAPGEVRLNISEEEVADLIAEGLATRSDISALRANVQAKKAAVDVAGSSLWPRLDAGASAYHNSYNYYNSLPTEIDNDTKYIGYLQLRWDFFDGFYNYNLKRAAEMDMEIALRQLLQAELKASADIWSQYYDFQAWDSKLEHSRAFLEESQTAYDMVMKGYKGGLQDVLDLLAAQRDLSDARLKRIRAQGAHFISLARLIHAAGGLSVEKGIDEKILGPGHADNNY